MKYLSSRSLIPALLLYELFSRSIVGSNHDFITSLIYFSCFLCIFVPKALLHRRFWLHDFFAHLYFLSYILFGKPFSSVFDSISFNVLLNLSSVVMTVLVLFFQYLFTFYLSKMALHWCNATPDSSFAHQVFKHFLLNFFLTLFIAFACHTISCCISLSVLSVGSMPQAGVATFCQHVQQLLPCIWPLTKSV